MANNCETRTTTTARTHAPTAVRAERASEWSSSGNRRGAEAHKTREFSSPPLTRTLNVPFSPVSLFPFRSYSRAAKKINKYCFRHIFSSAIFVVCKILIGCCAFLIFLSPQFMCNVRAANGGRRNNNIYGNSSSNSNKNNKQKQQPTCELLFFVPKTKLNEKESSAVREYIYYLYTTLS